MSPIRSTWSYGISLLLMSLVVAGELDQGRQEQSINAGGEASRERRVRSLFSRSYDPDDFGHITMYVRESCKDSFDSVRVPYARFDRGRLTISTRLIRYSRHLPIYADPRTHQTIIYTRAGVYFLPPMINERRKLFSLASLLADGYASFSKKEVRLSKYRSTDECFSPEKHSDRRSAKFDSKRRRFSGSIKTEYQSDYESGCYDDDDDKDRSSSDDDGKGSYQPSYQRPYDYDRPRRTNRSSRPTTASPRRCGISTIAPLNVRIIGGAESIPNSRPWHVFIVDGLGRLVCGGSLIDERHVLTAASCLPSRLAEGVVVVLGLHALPNFSTPQTQVIGADRLFIHEQFDNVQPVNDIAIIRLRRPARFDDFVSPICLPGPQPAENDPVVVAGWGIFNLSDIALATFLRELPIRVLNERANATYGPLFNPERQIGAGGSVAGGEGICLGDGGGALMFKSRDQWFAVGIASWTIACAAPNSADLYTRVFFYLDWIRKVISTS